MAGLFYVIPRLLISSTIGTLPSISLREWIEATYRWVFDWEHGQQFIADTQRTARPGTIENGVSAARACRIYETYVDVGIALVQDRLIEKGRLNTQLPREYSLSQDYPSLAWPQRIRGICAPEFLIGNPTTQVTRDDKPEASLVMAQDKSTQYVARSNDAMTQDP